VDKMVRLARADTSTASRRTAAKDSRSTRTPGQRS
jgi:hypothetical protein